MSSLDAILKFTQFLHDFRAVERVVLSNGMNRRENDVEHSYHLAMLAWYINQSHALGLDDAKLMRYALAHDLVEVYAGDTHFYHADQATKESKHDRELAAAHKIHQEFSDFPDLHQAIEEYERKEDAESKFIYALDKIEPMLSIYLGGGETWQTEGITLDMLVTLKRPKVAGDPAIAQIFEELIEKISAERDRLF